MSAGELVFGLAPLRVSPMELQTFKCPCGYQFPDITVSFQGDEIEEVEITVACPGCGTQYDQRITSALPS